MHAINSSLTAALLFIHAAFGCCWHHAHDCPEHSDVITAAEPARCEHQHPGDGDQHPCGCKIECGGACTYLAPQKVRIDSPHSSASLDVVASLPLLAELQVGPAAGSDLGDGLREAAPRVRLHLLHQLLLN